MRKQLRTILVVAGVALTTACGAASAGDQPVASTTAAQRLTVTALDTMRFEPSAITVRAGQPVQLTLQNRGSMPHDLSLFEGVFQPVKIEAEGGQSASATFTVEQPGTYTFVCTVASPSTTSTPGSASRIDGDASTLHDRLPPPSTIRSRPITRASTQIGSPGGRPNTVTPPISWFVSARVSSAEAKEARAPNRCLTARFTSRRVVASTTQAAYFGGLALPITRIVLAESSRAKPYAAQNAAVSARAGSHGKISYSTPRVSRLARRVSSTLIRYGSASRPDGLYWKCPGCCRYGPMRLLTQSQTIRGPRQLLIGG